MSEEINQEFLRLQKQKEEQDRKINLILKNTGEIRHITVMINEELEDQNIMLENTSERMNNLEGKLKENIQRIEKVVKSKSGGLFTVSVILTLLLILVLYFTV